MYFFFGEKYSLSCWVLYLIGARYEVRFIIDLFCNENNIYFLIISHFSRADSNPTNICVTLQYHQSLVAFLLHKNILNCMFHILSCHDMLMHHK